MRIRKKSRVPVSATARANRIKKRTSDKAKSEINGNELKTSIAALKGAIGKATAKYRVSLYSNLATAVGIGYSLMRDPFAWQEFCELEAWSLVGQPPEVSDIDDACRFVIRWACGLEDDGNKNASFYHGALKAFIDSRRDPSELIAYIEESGGLSQLRLGKSEVLPDTPHGQRPKKAGAKTTKSARVAGAPSKDDTDTFNVTFLVEKGAEVVRTLKSGTKAGLLVEITDAWQEGAAMVLKRVNTH